MWWNDLTDDQREMYCEGKQICIKYGEGYAHSFAQQLMEKEYNSNLPLPEDFRVSRPFDVVVEYKQTESQVNYDIDASSSTTMILSTIPDLPNPSPQKYSSIPSVAIITAGFSIVLLFLHRKSK